MKFLKQVLSAILIVLIVFSITSCKRTEEEEYSSKIELLEFPAKTVIDAIYMELLDGQDNWLLKATKEDIAGIFDIEEDMYEREDGVYILHTKVISQATRLVGIKAAPGKEGEIRAALENVLEKIKDYFENKYAAQDKISKNGRILQYTYGDSQIIFLLICDKIDEAVAIADEILGGLI